MTAPHEDLARAMAQHLALEFDKNLPALVERVIAEGGEGDAPPMRFDPLTIGLSFGVFVVGVAGVLTQNYWNWRNARDGAQKQAALDEAFLRGFLLSRLGAEVAELPPQITRRMKDAAFAAGVDAIIEEAKRLEGKR